MQPYEVICAPYTVYVAPTGTAFPLVSAAPSTAWTQLGTSGNKNYIDTGVTVTHSQTVNSFTPAGGTMPRKAWRTAEELTVALEIADLSPTQYAVILNNITVLTTAQVPGTTPGDQHFEVMRGVTVAAFAVLVRGISPINEVYSAQYEIAAAYNMGNPAIRYSKQGPATLVVEFHGYEQTAGILATWRAQQTP